MIVVNREGRIVVINSQTEKLFGYSREELTGQARGTAGAERFRAASGAPHRLLWRTSRAAHGGAGQELFGLRRDGREFPVEISLSPLEAKANTM